MSINHSGRFASIIILLASAALGLCWNIDDADPIATVRHGQVRGKKESPSSNYASDVKITSFIGIPYAAPPVGTRRFSDPREPEKWIGVLDATNRRVMCPQVEQRFRIDSDPGIRESEDCLYLNIQVISRGTFSTSSPVLVYFHGGEFRFGGKDFYSLDYLPPNLSGLVFVTVNYRLGPLGFLSTDSNEIHGNYGLRDMIMALRWVQSEISQFHGDPNTVIIAGHDAGGIAVSMLMLATHNEVLFNASIASGGTVFTPWAFEHHSQVITRELASAVNCGTHGLLRCLRQKSTNEIMSATRNRDLHFRPVIDRNLSLPLFRDEPEVQFRSGFFTKVPFIAGITENEGALDYYLRYRDVQSISDLREKIKYLIKPFVRRYANLDVMSSVAEFQYFGEEEARIGRQSSDFRRRTMTQAQLDEKLTQMLGDFLYNLPTEKALLLHSRFALRTKFYVFENQLTKPSFGMLQKDLPTQATRDKFGSTHMDDIFLLFKNVYTSQAIETNPGANNLLICMLTSIRDSGSSCNWQDYRENSRNFLRVSSYGNPGFGSNFRADRYISFWNGLFSRLEAMTVVIPPYFPEDEFQSYQAATWSLAAVVIILLFLAAGLALVIFIGRRNEKRSLKLIRKRNEEFSERGELTEKL